MNRIQTLSEMTISVSTNTVSLIENLLTGDRDITNKKNILIKDIKHRISHMNLFNKFIFLNVCLAKKVAPTEIVSLVKRTVSEIGASSRQFNEEKRILRMRILEKRRKES